MEKLVAQKASDGDQFANLLVMKYTLLIRRIIQDRCVTKPRNGWDFLFLFAENYVGYSGILHKFYYIYWESKFLLQMICYFFDFFSFCMQFIRL